LRVFFDIIIQSDNNTDTGRVNTEMVDVIVMAGGRGKRLKAGCPKALVRIGGRPLYGYILDETVSLPDCGKIFLVTPLGGIGTQPLSNNVTLVPTVGTYLGDVFSALDLSRADEALIVNADAILLTTEHLVRFLAEARTMPGGLIWPVIAKDSLWPEVQQTPVSSFVGNPWFTQGNAALVRPRELHPDSELLRSVCRYPALREILAFGVWNCIRAVCKKLPLAEVSALMSKRLNCQVTIGPFSIPELGFDIDHQEHLPLAEMLLKRQGRFTLP
jgi:GTP:adenosylcobinamide-phosphate guanylyltransferase